jgi:hypothetical protein
MQTRLRRDVPHASSLEIHHPRFYSGEGVSDIAKGGHLSADNSVALSEEQHVDKSRDVAPDIASFQLTP